MEDKATALLIVALTMTVIVLSTGLAIWLVMRLRRTSDRPLSHEAGGIVVPVRQLRRTFGFFGHSKNGISPRLELAPDGLRFKVFKPDYWRFADIAEVDAPWKPFGTTLAVRNREGARLYIDLADKTRGRDLLRALPQSVPLTRRATDMRDGAA